MVRSSSDSRYFLYTICALICCALQPWPAQATLFEDLGAAPGLTKIVDELVTRLITDPRISAHFKATDLERLRRQFNDQLCMIADGPCTYRGRTMIDAHKNQFIDMAAFNAVIEDLQAAMGTQGIPNVVQNQILARLAPMYRDIINH